MTSDYSEGRDPRRVNVADFHNSTDLPAAAGAMWRFAHRDRWWWTDRYVVLDGAHLNPKPEGVELLPDGPTAKATALLDAGLDGALAPSETLFSVVYAGPLSLAELTAQLVLDSPQANLHALVHRETGARLGVIAPGSAQAPYRRQTGVTLPVSAALRAWHAHLGELDGLELAESDRWRIAELVEHHASPAATETRTDGDH